MSGASAGEDTAIEPRLRETLELRLLETAARYLYVNSLPLPLVIVGFAILFCHWQPIVPVSAWGVASLLTWAGLSALMRTFLHDEKRMLRRRAWTFGLAAALFVATCTLTSIAVFFWVPGDRLNNVVLYVFVAAGLASAAGQSAPSRPLAFANLGPYAALFVACPLIHEAFPLSIALAALGVAYCALIAMYAKSVRQLACEMLLLREEKRALISRLETALADANYARKRAESASRAKSRFLANMSHELRTPLNAILGFSEVIRDRLFGDEAVPRYSEYAGNIHTSGSHLLGLINDILDLSKIEAGKLELTPEDFDLAHELQAALHLVEPQSDRKNIRIVRELADRFEVHADKRAIKQIAVNLLANAIKFTPPGGVVTLSLVRRADGSVVLQVRDTGIGIRPEDMERVLETFSQGRHDITPNEEQGTGLGLAIAKSLIEAHGGDIALESEVGEGTTVTITLPQLPALATQAA